MPPPSYRAEKPEKKIAKKKVSRPWGMLTKALIMKEVSKPVIHPIWRVNRVVERLLGDRIGILTDLGARLAGSNTAFLLERGWQGVLVEMNSRSARGLRQAFPGHVVIEQMVTPENVNELVHPESSFLDIDIDGNDYHVWKALRISPYLVMIESGRTSRGDYVPEYDPASKKRMNGASSDALKALGADKGYRFECQSGVNLYFVKEA